MALVLADIARMIDHSLLHPTLTDDALREGCRVARAHGVASVCIKPCALPLARELLARSAVALGTVVGFPHGGSTTAIKVAEAEAACADGAAEIDFVVNIGKVLSGDWGYVSREIGAVNDAIVAGGAISKVIFENDFYTDDAAIVRLCQICNEWTVAFVKTSTGYGFVRRPDGAYTYAGATDHHLRLMRATCRPEIRVKAAGGIRTLDDVLRVRALGVTRVGATATEGILAEARRRGL
jgi:deoxyribose-phosphate aldolase